MPMNLLRGCSSASLFKTSAAPAPHVKHTDALREPLRQSRHERKDVRLER